MAFVHRAWTVLFALAVVACGQSVPGAGVVVADGVARGAFDVRANGTDLIPVTVVFPADAEGRSSGGQRPFVLFIQGGAVEPERYEWQGVELARRGFVSVYPRHPLALAFFAVDHGLATRRALVDPPPGSFLEGLVDGSRGAVAGHSLGGVVAAKLATSGQFQAAVLQASFPDPADDAKTRALPLPTLSLAGKGDCQAKEAQVREGWEKLPSPTAFVSLEGVTHFQFTASDADDVKRGCVPTATLDDAHQRISAAMTAFLGDALSPAKGTGETGLRTISGSTVEVR